MPSTTRAVIFDLDGTLADSLGEIAQAMNAALAKHGLPPHPLDAYRLMVGEGAEILAERARPPGAAVAVAQLVADYRDEYAAQAHAASTVYPGVEELLWELIVRGLRLAVLSNKRDDFTRGLVAAKLPGIPFVDVRGERAGVPRKPDPTAAFELALALGVSPAHVAFVGDTAIDMGTAKAAGMRAIGVAWGFRSREELIAAGAEQVIEQPRELLAWLDRR